MEPAAIPGGAGRVETYRVEDTGQPVSYEEEKTQQQYQHCCSVLQISEDINHYMDISIDMDGSNQYDNNYYNNPRIITKYYSPVQLSDNSTKS